MLNAPPQCLKTTPHPTSEKMAALLSKTSFRLTTPIHQSFNRSFHASSANMTVKAYFECQWTGPQVTADSNGKILSTDSAAARKSPRHPPTHSPIHHASSGHRRPRGGDDHRPSCYFNLIIARSLSLTTCLHSPHRPHQLQPLR